MEKRKHVLLVGDLRTAHNYGAIATTEAMLSLIDGVDTPVELHCIDHRSFFGTSPENGFPSVVSGEITRSKTKRSLLVSVLKKMKLYKVSKRIQQKLCSSKPPLDAIPSRYDHYQEYSAQVLANQIWKYEKKEIEWADIILINSEGNIVNGTSKDGRYRYGGRYVLFFAYLSKVVFNKSCYILNHTVDPKNRDIITIIKSVYPLMDGIYVREQMSLKLLENWGVKNGQYVPDALWSADFDNSALVKAPHCLTDFDFSKPYICVGDSSGIKNAYTQVAWDVKTEFTNLIVELRKICPNIIFVEGFGGTNKQLQWVIQKNNICSVNITNCSYQELYYVLKNSQLFVSGRWHASILSLMGHTPVLLWGADSHKTEALYTEIDYSYEFFDVAALPLNIDRVVKESEKILAVTHEDVWRKVEELRTMAKDNVDML